MKAPGDFDECGGGNHESARHTYFSIVTRASISRCACQGRLHRQVVGVTFVLDEVPPPPADEMAAPTGALGRATCNQCHAIAAKLRPASVRHVPGHQSK